MLIHSDMLQNLVDKIISDISYNVNIIDTNGIIIASGEKNRIGNFHKAGLQAATNKCRIDINNADETSYISVKSGINLPFYYNKSLIGVIGITGDPSQISELINIVKSMIELMYEQEMLKQKMYYRQSSKVFFINELLNITNREALASIMNWGSKLGYDMNIRRNVIIVQFISNANHTTFFTTEDMTQDFILNLKKVHLHHKNDISTFLSSSRIIILKSSYEENTTKEKEHLQEYITEISKFISDEYQIEFSIGVGSFYDDLYYLKQSFFEAEYIINRFLHVSTTSIGYIHDYLIGYLSSRIPEDILTHFFEENYEKLKSMPELLETVVVLSKNNLHLSHCANDLFIHRNTVLFRLNKIKRILQLDPMNNQSDRAYWMLFSEFLSTKNI